MRLGRFKCKNNVGVVREYAVEKCQKLVH
jgi:hypothetical protein